MTEEVGEDGRAVPLPTTADLEAARAVVAAHLEPTPVVPLGLPGGRRVLAKLDSLQPTGSFKVRGALAAVSAYAARGSRWMVTGSTGNHAQAIVHAAGRLRVGATVVVPERVSPAKLAALRRTGADLVIHGASSEDAEAHARDLAAAAGDAAFVSPYNDPHVIAGQATWAAEAATQLDAGADDFGADDAEATLVVPVGGGGLLAGTALWAEGRPGVRVAGVEAAASRAVSAAVGAGHVVEVPVTETLADGLAGNLEPGCITPRLVSGRVQEITAVSEEEIAHAIGYLATRCGLVVEGAGATGVAALLAGRLPAAGRVVVLVTGRNLAPETLEQVLGGAGGAGGQLVARP